MISNYAAGLRMSSTTKMQFTIERGDLGQVHLPETATERRIAPRPHDLRQPGFDEAFDDRCVAYDVFLNENQDTLIWVGPPFLNLFDMFEAASFWVMTSDGMVHDVSKAATIKNKKKVGRIDIRLDDNIQKPVRLEIALGDMRFRDIRINDSGIRFFQDTAVAFTLFKYEPLSWLRAWAEFNVQYHKLDSLLIYENNCPHATTKEIFNALKSIEGLETLVVVAWPFKYGPQADGTGLWDSNFCQLGAIEHARERFLRGAECVLHGDIDELVITKDHTSLPDLLHGASTGLLRLKGQAVSAPPDIRQSHSLENRHYKYYTYKGQTLHRNAVPNKWALDPKRTSEAEQWLVHSIRKVRPSVHRSKHATLCHFIDMNTGWKVERRGLSDLEHDRGLAEALQRVFGQN